MSKQYQELDEKIVAEVRGGANEFGELASMLFSELEKHLPSKWHSTDRVLDRRLQALRRSGRLQFVRGGIGWSIPQAQP